MLNILFAKCVLFESRCFVRRNWSFTHIHNYKENYFKINNSSQFLSFAWCCVKSWELYPFGVKQEVRTEAAIGKKDRKKRAFFICTAYIFKTKVSHWNSCLYFPATHMSQHCSRSFTITRSFHFDIYSALKLRPKGLKKDFFWKETSDLVELSTFYYICNFRRYFLFTFIFIYLLLKRNVK